MAITPWTPVEKMRGREGWREEGERRRGRKVGGKERGRKAKREGRERGKKGGREVREADREGG